MSYHWVEDKAFLRRMRSASSDVVNQLVQAINNDGQLRVKAYLVGSGAKNLITQNANEPIDLDYNLEILDGDLDRGRDLKEYVIEMFDWILERNDWPNCEDSTSAITTEKRRIKGYPTEFSIDLCIVKNDSLGRHRLIHHKTGTVALDQYYWNQAPDPKDLASRVDWLKRNNCWNELRETYLEKKNLYLRMNDQYHPSFVVYIESVNEVYFKHNICGRNVPVQVTPAHLPKQSFPGITPVTPVVVSSLFRTIDSQDSRFAVAAAKPFHGLLT